MIVELGKKDIANLIFGCEPPYEMMEDLTKKSLGYFTGGFAERWNWTFDYNKMTEDKLWKIYQKVKR